MGKAATKTVNAPERRDNGRVSPQERAALGKAARGKASRGSHASWKPESDRDPVAILQEQARTRIPELVPIRYGRMLASPFAFLRGSAAVMAADLAATPRSGFATQICGDAHVSNFGLLASPERELLFDVNDFDETVRGPWEWDVKRLVASIAVAGRHNGFSDPERSMIERAAVAEYRAAMWTFAEMRNLDVWYAKMQVQDGLPQVRALLGDAAWKDARRAANKARRRDSLQAFSKLTHEVDGERRIISDPPLVVPIEELLPDVEAADVVHGAADLIRRYRRSLLGDRRRLLEGFRFAHLARKVVGIGSVGTRSWIVLMLGRDDDDPLFLQAKEAQPSVLEPHIGKSRFSNEGQRVVEGQRLMQAASDILLGWERTEALDGVSRDYYIRQLRDWKGSLPPEGMDPGSMSFFGRVCARTLARGHARSGDRIAIASYLGKSDKFDRALAAFAESYADQTERDHAALAAAVQAGRIEAADDP